MKGLFMAGEMELGDGQDSAEPRGWQLRGTVSPPAQECMERAADRSIVLAGTQSLTVALVILCSILEAP